MTISSWYLSYQYLHRIKRWYPWELHTGLGSSNFPQWSVQDSNPCRQIENRTTEVNAFLSSQLYPLPLVLFPSALILYMVHSGSYKCGAASSPQLQKSSCLSVSGQISFPYIIDGLLPSYTARFWVWWDVSCHKAHLQTCPSISCSIYPLCHFFPHPPSRSIVVLRYLNVDTFGKSVVPYHIITNSYICLSRMS